MPPMDLAVRAHRRFRHGTPERAEGLVEPDDGVEYTDMTQHDIDADREGRGSPRRRGTHAIRPRVRRAPKGPHAIVSVETTWISLADTGVQPNSRTFRLDEDQHVLVRDQVQR